MNALSPAHPEMSLSFGISPSQRHLHFRPHGRQPIADDLDRMADALASPGGRAWQPDADCIAAADQCIGLALRCYAAAGLSDQQMRARLVRTADELADEPADTSPEAAAHAVAAHCWTGGMSPEWTAMLLARMCAEIPGWEPCEPDEIAALVRRTFGRIA